MISSVEDQLVLKNITETLESLVEDIQTTYKNLNYPEPSEYDVRQLIASVNYQEIKDGEILKELNIYG